MPQAEIDSEDYREKRIGITEKFIKTFVKDPEASARFNLQRRTQTSNPSVQSQLWAQVEQTQKPEAPDIITQLTQQIEAAGSD